MKISRCPICKAPLTPGHKHAAKDAGKIFRKQASKKVRVLLPSGSRSRSPVKQGKRG